MHLIEPKGTFTRKAPRIAIILVTHDAPCNRPEPSNDANHYCL